MKKIDKPWGYEILYAESENYVGKILHIVKGECISLQFHNYKDETIFLSQGAMELLVEENGELVSRVMSPGDSYRIMPKVRHRFIAVEDCDILEVSTAQLDDTVRIEDKYGRIKKNYYAVIMAGGHGTRFWPRSRKKTPKQLLDIISSEPMIRETIKRINKVISVDNIYIIANEEHRSELERLIPEIPTENLIFEPMARNTASCIGLAAVLIHERNPHGVMAAFPADHLILDEDGFIGAMEVGYDLAAQKDCLITLGMKATHPETGYGYIKKGRLFTSFNGHDFFSVDRFAEKPEKKQAAEFIKSKDYYWNGGIFIWKTSVILDSIKQYLPNNYSILMEIKKRIRAGQDIGVVLADTYPRLEPISIDYGVLEHADNMVVLPADIGWSDIGGWAALDALIGKKTGDNNVTWSRHISIDTKNCIIYSPKKLAATIGIENIIIVETDDAILVAAKDRSQDVKMIIDKLKESGLEEYL
jgi:mannose-1-phosphate guanylyltransferase